MSTLIEQVLLKLDEEGIITFQANLMAGSSPRQALFNALGITDSDIIDTMPGIFTQGMFQINDPIMKQILFGASHQEIEETFWKLYELK